MKHLKQSPTDPEFVQNPYVFYDKARENGDLIYWEDYKTVCAVSFTAVSGLLKDRRFGREIPLEFAPPIVEHTKAFYDLEAHSMLELEPPRHTRLRSLVLRAFTSRRIKSLEPEITQLAHSLIDRFPDGEFDLLKSFCTPIPVIVICRLLGVPEENAAQLLDWSAKMVSMYQARRTREIEETAGQASSEFSNYIRAHIEVKRKAPADDLISELIRARDEGDALSEEELITTCILLLNAGHEATVHTMGNSVNLLLPLGIREVTPEIVEEAIRFDPPLHSFTRYAKEDVTVFGHDFKRGAAVNCLLASANRDPQVYENPNVFDPERKGPVNTSFGGGIHFCVGAPLARLELVTALKVLFERCPNLSLGDNTEFANVYHFHGLRSLMVRA